MTPALDQARKFLAKVVAWPQDGDEHVFLNIHSTFLKAGHDKPHWGGRAARNLDEAVKAIEWLSKLPDTREIYFCTSTQRTATEKTGKNDFKYHLPIRNQANAVKLKSLFLDVDCKGGKNGYPDLSAAVAAVGKFIQDAGLPKPSALVRSGGGVHVYWTVMRALTPAEWQPLANALAEATKRHGLKCDTQVTIDSARILRVAGTFNRKTEPPRPVILQGATDWDYKNEVIDKALEPYRVATPTSKPNFLESPELFKPRKPIQGTSDLAAGIQQTQAAPIQLESVLPQCGFLNEAVTTGGKDYTNPLWHLTTTIASFCENGRVKAHAMANGHPGYDPKTTDEFYDRVEREKATKGFGWPSCAKISACGARQCQSCPLFAQAKSPLYFAQRAEPAPRLPSGVTASPHSATNDLPSGYGRRPDGIILKYVTKEDGATQGHPICNYSMTSPWLQKSPWILHFTAITDTDGPVQLAIPTETCASKDTFLKWCHSNGLMLNDAQAKNTRIFFMSWIETLQKTKDAVVSSAPFGWSVSRNTGRLEGFVYGGVVWTPADSRPAANPDPVTAQQYMPRGEMEPWVAAAKMVTSQHRPELDAILAASFGAPLVRFTGESGLLMSVYSLESGIGKSTVLKVGQAVWGDPVRAMQGLADTQNAVLNKIGEIRSLPLFWDELKTEEDTRKFVNLAFQLSAGKEKSRLTQNAVQRNPGSWQTMLISASNDSLLDRITAATKATTAGLYRVFEYEVTPGTAGQIAPADAARTIGKLSDNYGQVGLAYARFLGANFTRVDEEVGDFLKALSTEVNSQPDERFWIALSTCVCMGARYANQLGFTTIDEDALRAFVISVLGKMRAERSSQPVDMKNPINVSNMLQQFLNAMRARHTIFTNRIHLGQGKPAPQSVRILGDSARLEGIYVQVGVEDKLLRFSSTYFHEWLRQREYPQKVLREALERLFGTEKVKARIAAGTRWSGVQEYLYQIHLAGTPLADFLDEWVSSGSGSFLHHPASP
jgi:hypothetical protein